MCKHACSILLLFLLVSSVIGQDDWHTYPFRDLATVIAGEQTLYEKTGKADMVISAQPFPSKTRVIFTGKKRALSEYGRSFIRLWSESRGMPASNVDLLLEEFLFLERGSEHWMPVVKGTAQAISKDLRVGDEVIIYYFYLGGFNPKSMQAKDKSASKDNVESNTLRWLFVVERVETVRSSFALMRLEDTVGQISEVPSPTEEVWIDPRKLKAKAKVVFAGEVREISGRRRQLRDLWFEKSGAPAGTSQLMQSEGLFKEGDKEYWIILRNQTRDHLRSYVKKGDTVYLNTILAGVVRNSGKIEWIFMSGEYSTF